MGKHSAEWIQHCSSCLQISLALPDLVRTCAASKRCSTGSGVTESHPKQKWLNLRAAKHSASCFYVLLYPADSPGGADAAHKARGELASVCGAHIS